MVDNEVYVMVFVRFKHPIVWFETVWCDLNKGLFIVPKEVYIAKRQQLYDKDFDIITEIQLIKPKR